MFAGKIFKANVFHDFRLSSEPLKNLAGDSAQISGVIKYVNACLHLIVQHIRNISTLLNRMHFYFHFESFGGFTGGLFYFWRSGKLNSEGTLRTGIFFPWD